VRAAIFLALNNLTAFPHVGRRQTTQDIRKIVVRPYGYLAYYTVDEDKNEVRVVTIRDPARQREHDDA
jgi:plasmid stabilization system protein ParE